MNTYIVNGKPYEVSLDQEEQFLKDVEKQGFTATLQQPMEVNQPQKNQKGKPYGDAYFTANEFSLENMKKEKPLEYKVDSDGRRLYYLDKGEVSGHGIKVESGWHREVGYKYDRSLGVRFEHDSYGKLDHIPHGAEVVIEALRGLRGDEKEKKYFKKLMKNRLGNFPEALAGGLISAKQVYYEWMANAPHLDWMVEKGLLNKEAKKAAEKKAEDAILDGYESLEKMEIGGEGVETPFGTLKRKYTGEGIVGGAKKGSGAEVLTGVFGAIMGMVETAVPAYFTRGASLPIQVAAPMYSEFNKEKAKHLYGDDPEAIEKLVENGESEIATPMALGLLATGLEYIGLKGVDDYIRAMPGKGRKLTQLLWTGNKEGFTEVGQLGFETINTERAKGKSVTEASKVAWDTMRGDEGLEMWLNGFIGSTGMSAAGSTINRALRNDDGDVKKINDHIDLLQQLNTRKHTTEDAEVKQSIDLQINQVEESLKNIVNNSRKLKDYLNEDQTKSLVNILNEKDGLKKRFDSLNEKRKNNTISQKEFDVALEGLTIKDKALSDNIVAIKNEALEVASKKQVETVKGKIEEMGLEGEVIERTADEISQMDLKDKDGKDVSKKASTDFGFIRQFKDGSFEITINKDKPALGTAAHEFLHAVLFKTLGKDNNVANELSSELIKHVSKLKGRGVENLLSRLQSYEGDPDFNEEIITVMSESMIDGTLKYDEGFFTKIGDILRRFFKGKLGYEYEFNTGRDVYNFIKDYNESIKTGKVNKAIVQVAKEGAKGELVDKGKAQTKAEAEAKTKAEAEAETKIIPSETVKKSKDSKPNVDNLGSKTKWNNNTWKKEGADKAIQEIKSKGLIDGLIAAKYKVRPVPENFVNDVLNSNFFVNHVRSFNPEVNDSLFGWINSQIRNKAGSVFNQNEKGKIPKGIKTVEADAKTTEGQPMVQLEDQDTSFDKIDEQDMTRRDKSAQDLSPKSKERKSTFRQEIGIKGIGKGIVFREVKKALRVAGDINNPKKFLKKYEETLAGSLFDYMKKIFPDANTMIKYRMAILESIPISTLKKWQKELPAKDNNGNDFGNIFVKNHGRKSDQDFLSDFMDGTNLTGKNPRKRKLLPDLKKLYDAGNVANLDKKDAVKNPAGKEYYRRKAAGITLWERLPVNSTTWTSYVNGNFIGKRQEASGSGTAGNNRTKILEASAVAIGKDATPENLTTEFIKDYISEKKLENKMTVEDVREAINETVDRQPDLKFSHDKKSAESMAARMQVFSEGSIGKGTKFPFVYKKVKRKKGGFKNVVDWDATAQQVGKEDRTVFEFVKYAVQSFVQENPQHYQTVKTLTTKSTRTTAGSVANLNKMVSEPNVTQNYNAKWDYSETGTRHLNTSRVRYNPKKKRIEYNVGTLKREQKWISDKDFTKQQLEEVGGLMTFANDIKTYLDKHPDQKWFITSMLKDSTNNMDAITRTSAAMMGVPVDANNKPLKLVEIVEEHVMPQNIVTKLILYGIENNNLNDVFKIIEASYMQLPLLKEHDDMIRKYNEEKGYGAYINQTGLEKGMPKFWWETIVPKILDGSLNIKDGLAGIVRYTASGINLNNYYLNNKGKTVTEEFGVGRYQNASELIVNNQNELIDQVLAGEITRKEAKEMMKEVIKLDNAIKISESQVKKSKNIRKAHDTINKFSKSGKVKGMSTFDFDETLIIDGENFVIATDPTNGQEIEISSADWPIKGPELAAMGYEMNFDDFVNVRGGVDGPLLQKMKNQINKYGVENVFILTARPQSADIAIHEWLKSKGINIPFKNITGLADSKGEAKANWMLEKFAEGYNDMYFVDDALSNVDAVREVLDQLDIKSKVVQAKTKVKVGGFLVDVTTQEGRDFIKQYNEIETVSTTDPDLANQKIKFSKSAEQTAGKLMEEFNKGAEKARKTIKILEDDLKSKGYTINPTSRSSEFKKMGGWIIDTTTKEGKEFVRDLENIPTVSSSDPGRVTKFSKSPSVEFNEVLEQTKGIPAKRIFSAQEAKKIGVGKGKNIFKNFFVPPSAEDFKGLLYRFIGRGEQGNAHATFFKENLLDPFAKANRNWNTYKQTMANDYKALKKEFKNVGKILNNKVRGTVFTNDNAIRVYLWDKAGFEIPGLSEDQKSKLIKAVENNPELKNFAEGLGTISRATEGYIEPNEFWSVESIGSDLNNIVRDVGRKDFFAEWIENKNTIFSPENLNKIEAIYGTSFRNQLENILYRMETGQNRKTGQDALVNEWLDWINGSVGAVMFFNMRSATLQTISMANFINMADNNPVAAAKAFANMPQYIKDFAYIFNSDMLKQRRAGLEMDVSANELTSAFKDGKSKPQAIIHYLLEKGFKPTQIADSFAIAAGGATFYRNRVNKYIKEGMSETKAKEQAWLDFQEVAEETQQSSRPDLISNQQAGPLGRLILAWQNTPMQMARLMKKKMSNLINRRRIPGYGQFQSDMANISGIAYYGLIQNVYFGALQTGLMFMLFGWDDDEERKEKLELRVVNGALDSILRGTGVYGAAISTLKNVLMKWKEEREKPGWKRENMNIAQELVNLSPPMGTKMRKIMQSIRTEEYNKGVSKEIGLRIENPNLSIAANWTEALTNLPVARVLTKANNIEEALTGNHDMWQRVALLSGWSKWSLGVEDEELEKAKDKAEETRKKEKKKKRVRCIAIKSSGGRCKNNASGKSKRCYAHK